MRNEIETKTFSLKIKEHRKALNLQQWRLAEILNVKQSTVANWENGNREPDLNMLVQISDLFKVSLDELLETGFYKNNSSELHILDIFRNLNTEGQSRMVERAEELSEIKRYNIVEVEAKEA